ncbi:hypothetical protein BGX23_012389 [Mortierella sp. AD031]|nr:hypothetical protein BGX23_012389 [Mortierella sp. AD031]
MQESTAVADTAQIKAIRMPELILVIGSHLNYLDLTRCIRVCRAWHLLLEPLLWRAFEYPTSAPRLRLGKHGASRTQPTLDQFRAMAHRIQRFICHREPPPHYIPTLIPTCRQLDQLHVFFTTPEVDDLLLQNKGTLRSLAVVSNMYRPDIAHLARQVLTDRVLQMDRLEELALFRFQVPVGAQGEAFLEICRRLWALELGRCKVDIVFPGQPSTTGEEGACGTGGQRGDNDNDNGAFTLPGLRRLKLDRNLMSTRNELALWKACTHLEDLTWVLTESTRIPDNVVDTTRVFPISEVCEHLSIPSSLSMAQSLVRLDIHLAQLSDEEFARLLGLLPRLQILIADDTAFGLNALAVLLGDDSSHTNNASNDSIDNNRRVY